METSIIKQVYDAINRNDAASCIHLFDRDAVRIEPAGHDTAGEYRGHAELLPHLSQGRSTWAEGGCYPKKFQAVGDRIIAFVHVHVRLKDKTEWIDGHIADVFRFKDGKITEFRTFWEKEEALEWLGVEED